jgi:hypothetical protein
MRPVIIVTALLAAGPLVAEQVTTSAPTTAPNPNLMEAKALTQEFATTLKRELEAAIQSGGPIKAIGVCEERAPDIAAGLSARTGWAVGRVSLKPRNAKIGQPDAWEEQVLTRFDERKAAGEPVETMAFSEVVEKDGTRQFRFMKAIPTGELCLACHGREITPEVTAALDEAYPGDSARGYAIGDVRGAFTLTKRIE